MKRRKFNKVLGGGLLSLPIFLNNCSVKTYDDKHLAKSVLDSDRILILIQLKGGNDGINSLVPLNQFDLYRKLRPTIGLKRNQVKKLDSTLSENLQLGVHPSLMDIKALYDQGMVSIIQSVAYPNVDRSHFKSTDYWMTGGDGSPQKNNFKTGWIGRFLQNAYPQQLKSSNKFPDPLGIQLGNPNSLLAFQLEGKHKCSINISGQDPSGYYTKISDSGASSPTAFPNSLFGEELKYISLLQASTSSYAQRISEVFNKGKNYFNYPDTDLSNQLKTVARLLHGGSKTKIFLVQLGDFDTHRGQVMSGDPITGVHSNLLKELGGAVSAFLKDVQKSELGDRVLAMTFSEFGRKAKENGSLGTDHGIMAPMFIFGKGLSNGVFGKNVDLSTVNDEGQLSGVQFDYRQVYATVLQDWLGASDEILRKSNLNYYSDKIPFIGKNSRIPSSK